MDRAQFDRIARIVGSRQTRRAAVAAFFGAALLGTDPGAARARRKGRVSRRVSAAAIDRCFPGKNCNPGAGRITPRCDFAFSTLLRNKNVQGANLSRSSFAGADLRGADFRGSNLSGGCFASADLTGAKLGSSVNLRGAVFCNTTMPDGTIDNSGCEGETPCCHLRVQDCPDAKIECYTQDSDGCARVHVGDLGPVGNCWQFLSGCCPCDQRFPGYWNNLCTATFPGACSDCRDCTGTCVAQQADIFPPCANFKGCIPLP